MQAAIAALCIMWENSLQHCFGKLVEHCKKKLLGTENYAKASDA
jgi:hypothetical protein